MLSALFGIALEEGRVKLSDSLASLGINDKPPGLTSSELQATPADLAGIKLRMPPGEFWFYNNWDFNAAGSIYEKITASGTSLALSRRWRSRPQHQKQSL